MSEIKDKNINQEGSLKDWKEKFEKWKEDTFLSDSPFIGATRAGEWIEENVIAPLLQNEYEGDDLESSSKSLGNGIGDAVRSSALTQIGQKKALVISGFPGIGKSYFQKNSPLTVLDSDSSTFSWKEKGVRNENFPDNYIQHIRGNLNYVDIILVSSHKEVRTALYQAEIDFLLVYPKKALKDEYIGRFKARGNDDAFISFIDKNWEAFIDDMQAHPKEMTVRLGTGQYLSDHFLLPNTSSQTLTQEQEEKYYPGIQYQRLFNAISETKGIALQSDMDEIIRIVHEDFPLWVSVNDRLPDCKDKSTAYDGLFSERVLIVEEHQNKQRIDISNCRLDDINVDGFMAYKQQAPTHKWGVQGNNMNVTHWMPLPKCPIELVNPERNASPRTPNHGDEAGNNQNKTSNSEATILSAPQILGKYPRMNGKMNDVLYEYGEVIEAMEEYHNQFK